MAFNVDTFRQQGLMDDGARPNLFEVELRFPGLVNAVGNPAQFRFMCKAAQVPGSNMGVIEVPYFGRQVKVAGNRTYDDWTVTVLADEKYVLRRNFENWHRIINDPVTNLRTGRSGVSNSDQYTSQVSVIHYNKLGKAFRKYTLVGAFPSNVAPIDLDWGSNDTLEEFTVTFAYQYWLTDESSKVSTGSEATVSSAAPDVVVNNPPAQGATAENVGLDGFTAGATV